MMVSLLNMLSRYIQVRSSGQKIFTYENEKHKLVDLKH